MSGIHSLCNEVKPKILEGVRQNIQVNHFLDGKINSLDDRLKKSVEKLESLENLVFELKKVIDTIQTQDFVNMNDIGELVDDIKLSFQSIIDTTPRGGNYIDDVKLREDVDALKIKVVELNELLQQKNPEPVFLELTKEMEVGQGNKKSVPKLNIPKKKSH